MKVKTNQPITTNPIKVNLRIAKFWDKVSPAWQKIWGQHIHHGYYEAKQDITPAEAQEKLIEKLLELISIKANDTVLDLGCGMGGTSLYIAKKFGAKVSGISLSPRQVKMAAASAAAATINNVDFKVEDAHKLTSFADNSFDIVWSLESCEQFYDKPLFLANAYRVLKNDGQLMLATWCSDREEYDGHAAQEYQKLCRAFDLPYMPTMEYYRKQLQEQGFTIKKALNWSMHVEKSWSIGTALIKNYSFWQLLKLSGLRGLIFARQIKLMQRAFLQHRIKYGVFIATKKAPETE